MSSEFGAAILGAIVGGLIAFAVQMLTIIAARKEKQEERKLMRQSLGHSLVFKATRIHSHHHGFRTHIEACQKMAETKNIQGELWQYIMPVANLPDQIFFSSDEMSMLLSLGDNDLFNDIVSLDELHNATVAIFAAHSIEGQQLRSSLPVQAFDGVKGTSTLNAEQMSVLRPKMISLNSLAESIVENVVRDEEKSWDVLVRMTKLFRKELGISTFVQLKKSAK